MPGLFSPMAFVNHGHPFLKVADRAKKLHDAVAQGRRLATPAAFANLELLFRCTLEYSVQLRQVASLGFPKVWIEVTKTTCLYNERKDPRNPKMGRTFRGVHYITGGTFTWDIFGGSPFLGGSTSF
jgi:hypothetical protein